MGRTVTTASLVSSQRVDMPAGFLGMFGAGNFKVFLNSGTFPVPPGVTRLRVRVLGGGAGFTYTYQSVPTGLPGGTSSFGSLISATGGTPGTQSTPGIGGKGVGGDFQANGGKGGKIGGGGGAAGSQLGDGGDGGDGANYYQSQSYYIWATGGGGGVGGGKGGVCVSANAIINGTSDGGSPYGNAVNLAGPDWLGNVNRSATAFSPVGVMRFPFDTFPGGGAVSGGALPAGPGGGGAGTSGGNTGASMPARHAGIGGGGPGLTGWWGMAGVMGGGAGGGILVTGDQSQSICGCGGGGYAHGIFSVTPGDSYTVTVAAMSAGNPTCGPSAGLVVVEW